MSLYEFTYLCSGCFCPICSELAGLVFVQHELIIIACLVWVSGCAMVLVSKLVDDLPLEADLVASLSLLDNQLHELLILVRVASRFTWSMLVGHVI